MTPAQASGHPDFVTDWPISGPTDPGMRAADCWYAQNRLPTPEKASCVDCKGPIPMLAQRNAGLGEQVSLRGRGTLGFSLSAAGDPEIWNELTADQQAWILSFLSVLNGLIVKQTGTMCPAWKSPSSSAITNATGCFQSWFDSVYPPGNAVKQLRTDGVFDQDTLSGMQLIASLHPSDFPTPYPAGSSKKLSTAEVVGIGAAAAAALGGGYYLLANKKKTSRRKRK
jgi:hypothetical protein